MSTGQTRLSVDTRTGWKQKVVAPNDARIIYRTRKLCTQRTKPMDDSELAGLKDPCSASTADLNVLEHEIHYQQHERGHDRHEHRGALVDLLKSSM